MRCLLLLLLSSILFAQDIPPGMAQPKEKIFTRNISTKLWTASAVLHLTTTMADAGTSSYLIDKQHAGYEANSLIVALNGGDKYKFGVAGFALKLGVWAVINVPVYVALRHNKKWANYFVPIAAIANTELSGCYAYELHNNLGYIHQ